MAKIDKEEIEKKEQTGDQFAKLMLGTAAGFIASKVVTSLWDNLVIARRESKTKND